MKENHERLMGEWSYLQRAWANARNSWKDEMAELFKKTHWKKWEKAVPEALAQIDKTGEILRQISRDRGD